MEREIKRVAEAAADEFEAMGSLVTIDQIMAEHRKNVARILGSHYINVGNAFGARIMDAGEKAFPSTGFELAGMVVRPLSKKDTRDDFVRRMTGWIQDNGAKKVVQVSDTTKEQIRRAVSVGAREGFGHAQTAKLIREKTGGTIARMRSKVIARTETHAPAVFAGDAAVEALGLDMVRDWIASGDGRTRSSHALADGQKREMNRPFDVGGAKLMRPGDPSAPAREIINCRCGLGYVTAEEAEDKPAEPSTLPVLIDDDIVATQNTVRKWTVEQGKKTGHEHLSGVDLVTGKRLPSTTSKKVNSVDLTPELKALVKDPKMRIELHHNHPSSSSFSLPDVQVLAHYPGLEVMVANGHDGSIFTARKGSVTSGAKMQQIVAKVRGQVRPLFQKAVFAATMTGQEAGILLSVVVNNALGAVGVFGYTEQLSASSTALLEAHAQLVHDARLVAQSTAEGLNL